MIAGQVMAVTFAESFAELLQTGYVAFGKEGATIRSDADHELRTVAYALIVERQQLLQAFERGLVPGMPKPVQVTQRRVRLDRPPTQIAMAVDHIPVFVLYAAALRSSPTRVTI